MAAILRFYKLGEWSFWYDEIFTLRDISRIFELSLTNQQVSRWLIFGVINTLGTSEFSARLVPALVGVLSVPVLYFPTRKMFDPPTPCCLLYSSPFPHGIFTGLRTHVSIQRSSYFILWAYSSFISLSKRTNPGIWYLLCSSLV